jgi:hypothetical protein
MMKIFSIYLDVREVSPELAEYIKEDHPWVEERLDEAENIVSEREREEMV